VTLDADACNAELAAFALPEILDGTVNAALVSLPSEPIGITVGPKPAIGALLLLGLTTYVFGAKGAAST
jgi:hypothetical protein